MTSKHSRMHLWLHLRSAFAALWLSGAVLSQAAFGEEQTAADSSGTYLSTVIIYTPDMQGLARFYEETLEIGAPVNTLPNHIGYWLGSNYLGFEPVDRVTPNPGGATVWFGVRNIETTLKRLASAGARLKMPATRQAYGDIHATVVDPDGNLIGLIESGDARL